MAGEGCRRRLGRAQPTAVEWRCHRLCVLSRHAFFPFFVGFQYLCRLSISLQAFNTERLARLDFDDLAPNINRHYDQFTGGQAQVYLCA